MNYLWKKQNEPKKKQEKKEQKMCVLFFCLSKATRRVGLCLGLFSDWHRVSHSILNRFPIVMEFKLNQFRQQNRYFKAPRPWQCPCLKDEILAKGRFDTYTFRKPNNYIPNHSRFIDTIIIRWMHLLPLPLLLLFLIFINNFDLLTDLVFVHRSITI